MNSIISLFVCLAMLVSGAGLSADPNAAAARTAVISDIVLTIEGESYALNPQIAFGVQTENNSALFDFGILSGEDVLFPMQVKLDDAGVALQADDSSAYVLPAALIDEAMGADILSGEAVENYISSYSNLMGVSVSAMQDLEYYADLAQKEMELLNGIIGDVPTEETTIFIHGADQPATIRSYTLNQEQIAQLLDEVMNLMPESYKAAYEEYWAAYTALMAPMGVELPATMSVSDILAESGMEITMDVTETLTADGAGFISAVVTETVTIGEVSETFQFPMEIAVDDADTMNLVIQTAFEEEDFDPMNMIFEFNMDGAYLDASMVMTDNTDTIAMYAAVYQDDDMDGDVNFVIAYDCMIGGMPITMNFNNEGSGANFEFDMGGLNGLSFHIEQVHGPIEDRIASAKQVVFESWEDENAINGLSMAFLGLMSDVEKLMGEESIAALAEAFMFAEEVIMTEAEESSVGVIGGADGPTSIIVATETPKDAIKAQGSSND